MFSLKTFYYDEATDLYVHPTYGCVSKRSITKVIDAHCVKWGSFNWEGFHRIISNIDVTSPSSYFDFAHQTIAYPISATNFPLAELLMYGNEKVPGLVRALYNPTSPDERWTFGCDDLQIARGVTVILEMYLLSVRNGSNFKRSFHYFLMLGLDPTNKVFIQRLMKAFLELRPLGLEPKAKNRFEYILGFVYAAGCKPGDFLDFACLESEEPECECRTRPRYGEYVPDTTICVTCEQYHTLCGCINDVSEIMHSAFTKYITSSTLFDRLAVFLKNE